MEEVTLVALKCPNCGGRLEVSKEMSHFACGYCGANVQVQRRGGTIALSLGEAIERVQVATDKTAAELALKRLKEEAVEAESTRESIEGSVASEVARLQAALARREEGKSDQTFTSIVFVAVWILVTLIAKAFKSLQDSAGGVGFIAACVAALPVWLILVKGRAAQVLRLKRQIEEVRRKGKEDVANVDAKIADIKARIAKNRAIVDA